MHTLQWRPELPLPRAQGNVVPWTTMTQSSQFTEQNPGEGPDSTAQHEQRTVQHRVAPMYRMPESSGTQPQFVASDKHDTAGEHYDHRLLEVQSISGGGVQTTPAPDDEDIAHAVQMAGLEKSCSSSSMCYCCRWTIRRQSTAAMCDVPHYVTVEEPVCVQIVEDVCVQTAIQPR
ncbi:hypothetical protein C0Q70_07251 [Pomacea canaliculata]|uniref:Uncharacterized protein n=1 Tax=Pomacea canaliculata TaxID=400727 RepID=A0A2T7PEI7_POMCA|nr:hypothetical protein C0Q70_07251 [Pomacea canaliculata]